MASLDKLSLNNQIVLMRHDVRRAKLHTINKVVKETRTLKKKQGTEEQKSKYLKKVTCLIELVQAVKNLEDDEVSKFFLTNKEDLLSILSNPKSELKTKALAKVCTNKLMKASVFEFKKKYPNWEDEVPILLPQLGKHIKKSKNKSVNQKENNLSHVKVNSPNKKERDCADKSNYVATSGNNRFLVEIPDNKERHESLKDKKGIQISKKSKKFRNETEPANNKNTRNDANNIVNEKSNKRKLDNLDSNTETLNKEKFKIQKNEKKVADPFFVTADNNEYMTVVTSEKQIEALKKPDENLYSRNNVFGGFKNDEINNDFGGEKYRGFKKPNRLENKHKSVHNKYDRTGKYDRNNQPWGNEKKFNYRSENKFGKKDSSFKQHNIPPEEKLHPSWEAKKKQSSLTQFSGKKIVFNDD